MLNIHVDDRGFPSGYENEAGDVVRMTNERNSLNMADVEFLTDQV